MAQRPSTDDPHAGCSAVDPPTALLVIDLQQALCEAAPAEGIQRTISRISDLLDWAEARSWTIVFIQHSTEPGTILERGSEGWQLAPALVGRQPSMLLEKDVLSCFADGQLHAALKENNIERVCVTGMQTEFCISAACEGAVALGYSVLLPTDAHMTIDRPDKSATQIIRETNDRLSSLADCRAAASLLLSGNG